MLFLSHEVDRHSFHPRSRGGFALSGHLQEMAGNGHADPRALAGG